ncbi:prokaryotic molybdopterin-containing oxidoreductase family, iron-sulfur binding subunit [Pustulibacterium marinum]|uniref:Prokaryotic molybdopterin-containing oxidoreductase family, iron-sulfur binding subunit n=1 Tax=Pustulibacterium marinum TaxID=1224947 RepID=A0A1I7HAF9_9FLAO|nr:TAT-variant-translocated molybdopterin oxidoreductase [Pustulibacterium marinum]SFU57711.1 prokaryotic molybdopterin-containing oxidoreductase family, iron-sulfur binding subunit [Pustulibacterium marinum]
MASNKKYWVSVEELKPENSSKVETLKQNEFVNEIPVDQFLGEQSQEDSSATSRRDFLKFVGFSTAAASLAACEGPVKKAIPYVVQPEEIRPGVANYYASTIADGYDFASVLVKTREGRPIFVKNHDKAEVNSSANARVVASVLSMYDTKRVQGPKKDGKDVSWSDLNADVKAKIQQAKAQGKDVVFLTQTFASPSTAKLVSEYSAAVGGVKHVIYDAVSEDAALNAFEAKYGTRAMADYDLSKAEVIVSFDADFIADWQGGGFEGSYAKGRVPSNGKMSRHVQFESNMSLTGANADKRVALTPSQVKIAIAKFYGAMTGVSIGGSLPEAAEEAVKAAAKQVKKAGSKAVVLTGLQDDNAQALALAINESLSSEAFDPSSPLYTRKGNFSSVQSLIKDMNSGKVGVLVMVGVNPLYTLAEAKSFEQGLSKVGTSVVFSMKEDETALKSTYVAAMPHYLESWGDVEIKKGHYSLMQPTIRPLFDTMQFQDALLNWMGNDTSYYEYVKENWTTSILNGSSWNQALHDGVYKNTSAGVTASNEGVVSEGAMNVESAPVVLASGAGDYAVRLAKSSVEGVELMLYTKTGMGDGQQANNPWLQEFPDPITRNTWDNYLTVSKADADAWGFENTLADNGGLDGSYAKITVNGVSATVPVLIQPGQAKGSVGLALGYGKKEGVQEEMQVGVNAYPFYFEGNNVQPVKIEKVSGTHEFASVQMQNTLDGRGDILRETTLEVFNTENAHHWNPQPEVSMMHQEVEADEANLWQEFDTTVGHHFNLSIDLSSCTGCGACVIACHAENNVPVVGKSEIRKFRDMHWLRIDRYYSSEESFEADVEKVEAAPGAISTYHELEDPSANPQVAFQPVMCQHCNHAPCETVCPVAATSHGRQGQNQMIYNRCVGTRYCANNCPYKVRRFNWFLYAENDEFDFHMNNDLGRMVLNPDVVVRSRGVMEKCSMCMQMTQKTILDAKREGRTIEDGEFQTACSAACSTGAMVFGDVNNKESEISKLKEDDRMYHLLGFKGTRPNVIYQVKVRNTEEA